MILKLSARPMLHLRGGVRLERNRCCNVEWPHYIAPSRSTKTVQTLVQKE